MGNFDPGGPWSTVVTFPHGHKKEFNDGGNILGRAGETITFRGNVFIEGDFIVSNVVVFQDNRIGDVVVGAPAPPAGGTLAGNRQDKLTLNTVIDTQFTTGGFKTIGPVVDNTIDWGMPAQAWHEVHSTTAHVVNDDGSRLESGILLFGSGGGAVPDVRFRRTAIAVADFDNNAGGAVTLQPTADGVSLFGTSSLRWADVVSNLHRVFAAAGAANPTSQLESASLRFGPGGATALDTEIRRTTVAGFDVIELTAPDLVVIPTGDGIQDLGGKASVLSLLGADRRWRRMFASLGFIAGGGTQYADGLIFKDDAGDLTVETFAGNTIFKNATVEKYRIRTGGNYVYTGPALAGAADAGAYTLSIKAGAPVDADFTFAENGMVAIDNLNKLFYFRAAGIWNAVSPGAAPGAIYTNTGANNVASGAIRYAGIGGTTFSATEADVRAIIMQSAVLRQFAARANTNTSGGNIVVNVRVNGVNTGITVTIPGGSTALFTDLVNTFPVVAGDLVAYEVDRSAGGGGALSAWRSGSV